MKHIFIGLLLLLAFTSCSKDDDQTSSKDPYSEQNNSTKEDTRYYVKYEVTYSTYHVNESRVVKFETEKGMETISLNQQSKTVSWEGTYGPVKKHFVASLDCDTPGYDWDSQIHARIYVCREKEPFVIKAEGEKSHSLLLQYKTFNVLI